MGDTRIVVTDKLAFDTAIERLMQQCEIYAVVKKSPSFMFDRLSNTKELILDYDTTLLPPNRYLIPNKDTLMRVQLSPELGVISRVAKVDQSILLGVHPDDMYAIKLLDAVFTTSLVDTNYFTHRSAMTIIGVDNLHPWRYSFAASMGTVIPPPIFDLWLSDLGERYIIEVASTKGNNLLDKYFKVDEPSEAQVNQRNKLRHELLQKYELSLEISPQEIPSILERAWSHPMWAELGRKCFSCGSCTMVCPTCICFDVRDGIELNMKISDRDRYWDSCMFQAFSLVASGENFRPTGTDRLRHRLYRKGKYMLERWGELGCVGCGRCIHACLVDIASPVSAYNQLAQERDGT